MMIRIDPVLRQQLVLCYVAFASGYLMCNTIPYAPFMTITLLPNYATAETVGKFSAFFTSCYIWGRSSGAGFWGNMADTKGRIPALKLSLCFSAVFSLAFGLSNNYFLALGMRFCMGLFADIDSILKTLATEIAGDDDEKEAHSMNLVISAWAVASLLSPAIGGFFSDPVKQFQIVEDFLQQYLPRIHDFLVTYRYFLPNLIGTLICMLGFVIVALFIDETLPSLQNGQHGNHSQNGSHLSAIDEDVSKRDDKDNPNETQSLLCSNQSKSNLNVSSSLKIEDSYAISQEATELARKRNIEATIRDSYRMSNDLEGVILNRKTRQSMAMGIRRSTVVTPFSVEPTIQEETVDAGPPTILTFLKDRNTRNQLILYCIGCFLICFHQEAFPLFCLSKTSGLGLSEATIGGIMMVSGIAHACLQPTIYGYIFVTRGLNGSMQWAATLMIPIFFLIPFSMLSQGTGSDDLRWTALTFLGVVVGLGRTFGVTFYSSIGVSMNHLVAQEYRATFNGLLTRISGGCKGSAPIIAGVFVSVLFNYVSSNGWGAIFLYMFIGFLGIVFSAASFALLGTDDS